MGVRQTYGAEPRHKSKHTQWLTTGGGILHEEMFDLAGNGLLPERQELYQLWLNLPAGYKLESPSTILLGGDDETPLVTVTDEQGLQTETLLLAGEYQGRRSVAPIESDLAILHVRMEKGATWTYSLPGNYENVILYLRQGSLTAGDDDTVTLPVHHTVQFERTGGSELVLHAATEAADFVLLAGEPIREPCVAQGSMVMNTAAEINKAYQDYEVGYFGRPWPHTLSDEDWKEQVRKFPSRYL
jgi:redox-sensitive bicupin YhaK (pirin superfamily)